MSQDPTALNNLIFDPFSQRMKGVTIHGDMHFDAPFISQITDTLYVGGCQKNLVLPKEIDHVVSLYQWGAYRVKHDLRSTLTVEMYDSLDGPDISQVIGIAQWVNIAQLSGNVLVHCQAGLNRSNLIAGASLLLQGATAVEAIALLRSKRSPAVLCNPTFVDILVALDLELKEQD